MARQKTPSPQELYRARKAREEKEKSALLPPGLANHGNTCFMNSVLQALIATKYLQLAVHFQPLPPPLAIASRRSPLLTNGHGLGREHDLPWSDALPVGDELIAVLRTAWDIQNNRKSEHIIPKDLLVTLGKKYDQYLDFRQQDAHEFLCQLLDAVRMEEMDVIKQRSSPQKKTKKSRRSQTSRPHHPATTQPDDGLVSFVDMLFGGKLASILVCQACKHVSHTYEDFSDLCLSMKPEDYVRERKRDKLKQIAKRIGTAFYVGVPQQRSSSVPATPVRDSNLDSPDANDTQRRRSIDLAGVEMVAQPVDNKQGPADVTKDDAALQVPPSPGLHTFSLPGTPTDTPQPTPITDSPAPMAHQELPGDHISIAMPEKPNGKERKSKDESWAKISRRISVSVGLTRRPKGERKDKKATPSATPVLKPADDEPHAVSAPVTPDTANGLASPSPRVERESSLGLVNERLQSQLTNVKRSVMPSQGSGNSPSGTSAPRFPLISRPSSPGMHSKASKRPRAPKLSAEEAAYLRDILADINPPNIPKPFSIFKQYKEPGSSTSAFNSQNIFLRVNQISRIEECLRLFTSVEVLDGENTVRCHRCWKIANGFYEPRARGSAHDPDSCTDSEDDAEEAVDARTNGDRSAPGSSPTNLVIPVVSPSDPTSPSHSTTSLQYTQTSRDTPPTQPSTRRSSIRKHVPPALRLNDGYPIELVSPVKSETPTKGILAVPSISTTAPESPLRTAKPAPISTMTQTSVNTEYSSRPSLSAPSDQHRQHGPRSGDSNTESEISEAESELLLSAYSDLSSAASSNPSPNASQEQLQQPSPTPDTRAKDKPHPSGVPRSRQYLLRPAYKRYLIATPPPVLIVQLKRFQQLSKAPVVSFATGFKKLDDYIAFPEYLDLAPYLAPKREDYFDSKVAVARGRVTRRAAPCMYRLYAVVVHIGNMLGGHYVAYTALPPSPSPSTVSDAHAVRPESERQSSDNSRTTPASASRDWAFISDTIVRLSSLEEVLKSKAYICMYERI